MRLKLFVLFFTFLIIKVEGQDLGFISKAERIAQPKLSQSSSTLDTTYETIVDTLKIWVVYNNSSSDPSEIGYTSAFKIKDSTLLTDNEYWFKVWEARDSLYSEWELHGYIKEANKMVVYIDYQSQQKDTIYNFNKAIGDTLNNECDVVITDLDNIQFAGALRTVQYLDAPFENYEFLNYEGIGSEYGLITPFYYCYTGVNRTLVCYYNNGNLLYKNPNFDNCYINTLTDILKTEEKQNFKIYPNPFTQYITVDILNEPLDNETFIKVFNLDGKLIYLNFIHNKMEVINLSHLLRGVYVYSIYKENNLITYGKIIKN